MSETSRGEMKGELQEEGLGARDAFEQWFFQQRAYPSDSIPANALGAGFSSSRERNDDSDDPPEDVGWRALGPSTIPNGQTDGVAGGPLAPVSGRLTAIAIDPTQPRVVYASGAQGGVWKTRNALSSHPHWTPLMDHEPSLAVGSIAIDPADRDTIYVGTGEPNRSCDSYYGRGILRSRDGGRTWKVLGGGGSPAGNTGPFVGKAVARIIIDPATAGSREHTTLWASTTIGVYTSGTSATCSIAGAAPFGLWRSTDSGETWQLQSVPSPGSGSFSVQDLALDPTNHETLYVGVRSNGVWKSTNAATGSPATFTKLTNGFPTGSSHDGLRRINLSIGGPGAATTVYAAVENSRGTRLFGLFKTTDAGATWSNVDNGFNGTANITGGSTTVTRVTGPGFVTGGAWVGRRFIAGGAFSLTVASVTDADHLELTAGSPASAAGISWSTGAYPNYCDGQCFYDMTVKVDPNDASGNRVYVGGNPHGFPADLSPNPGSHVVWRSDDGGATWTSISEGNGLTGGVHTDDHAIAVDSEGRVYDGNDGGIWRSDDFGASWTSMNTDIAITQFQGVSTHPFDKEIVLGGTQDNGTNLLNESLVSPPGWFHADFGDGGESLIDQSTPQRMFHTYFNQSFNFMGPAKSTVGGVGGPGSWEFVGAYYGYGPGYYNGMDPRDPVSFYAPLAQHPAFSPNVVYFGSDKVYRAPDPHFPSGPPSWTAVSPSLTAGAPGAYVSWIGVLPNLVAGKEVLYAGSSDGQVSASSNVDGTGVAAWAAISASPLPNRSVTGMDVTGADPTGNTAFVAFSGFNSNTPSTPGHVFLTTNGLSGAPTWTDISGDLPDLPVNQVVSDYKAKRPALYAASDVGVFRSRDGGKHWKLLSRGLPFVTVFGLQQNATTGQIVASTHGRGMFELVRQEGDENHSDRH